MESLGSPLVTASPQIHQRGASFQTLSHTVRNTHDKSITNSPPPTDRENILLSKVPLETFHTPHDKALKAKIGYGQTVRGDVFRHVNKRHSSIDVDGTNTGVSWVAGGGL